MDKRLKRPLRRSTLFSRAYFTTVLGYRSVVLFRLIIERHIAQQARFLSLLRAEARVLALGTVE
jgi:hypothetical protein